MRVQRPWAVPGSSPRGRGTPVAFKHLDGCRRFIPARAGNADPTQDATREPPVHPRAGGERCAWGALGTAAAGSSPRGRGTRRGEGGRRASRRFIPARAGNATRPWSAPARPSVHPRAGGERPPHTLLVPLRPGSSPRGRGTPNGSRWRHGIPRFIPARAGNATRAPSPKRWSTVHPRAGGERSSLLSVAIACHGSSPRGRGTQSSPCRGPMAYRFIPARAGNAEHVHLAGAGAPVHPRAGGERDQEFVARCAPAGSSPRGRGTLDVRVRQPHCGRFIPARAGNACLSRAAGWSLPVHPRAGGERVALLDLSVERFGSSPRGRGTHVGHDLEEGAHRFIPARAGNARRAPDHPPGSSVHPRAGGERDDSGAGWSRCAGSSPRGRGTPGHLRAMLLPIRFIPARAGNALPARC